MGNIKMNSKNLSFTLVPDFIVLSFLRKMSPEASKVLLSALYELKGNNINSSAINTEKLAEIAGVDDLTVNMVFEEFKNLGLIVSSKEDSSSFEFICEMPLEVKKTNEDTNQKILNNKASVDNRAENLISTDTVDKDAEAFKELTSEIEMLLGSSLNPGMLNFIISLREEFFFPDEVILMLFSHCASKNKTGIKYMEQVAVSWKEKGIKTLEDVNNVIKEYEEKWIRYRKALNYMGLKADYVSYPHEKMLDRWFDEYKFSDNLIQKACDITVHNIGKTEIPYMDAILTDWYKKGVRKISDLEKLKEDKGRRRPQYNNSNSNRNKNSNFNNFEQRQNNYKELENDLLGWIKNE